MAGLHKRITEQSPLPKVRFEGPGRLENFDQDFWVVDDPDSLELNLCRELIVDDRRFGSLRIPFVVLKKPQREALFSERTIMDLREQIAQGDQLYVHGEQRRMLAIERRQIPLEFVLPISSGRNVGTIDVNGKTAYAFSIDANDATKSYVKRVFRFG